MNKRQLALSIYQEWNSSEHFIDHLFESRLFSQPFPLPERHWVQFIISGTIEKWWSIQFVLHQVTQGKFNKNKRIVKDILYLSCFEILYTSNADYAVINESVDLCKQNKKAYEAKIVNGVLREIARTKEDLLHLIATSKRLDVRYNIPVELHTTLRQDYTNEELVLWYQKLQNRSQGLWVRRNRLKLEKEPTFYFAENFAEIKEELLEGVVSVQDRSAGEVVEFMEPKQGTTILDYCSAPGGKTTYIAELTNDQSVIIASDSDEFRLSKVKENTVRLGLTSVQCKPLNELNPYLGKCDQVLLDIPCSGLGVLSKRLDLKHRFSNEKLENILSLQKEVLKNGAKYVKDGGELIVSTCTILRKENQELIDHFLNLHPDFTVLSAPFFRLPFEGKHDGAFAIKLKKN